MINIADISIIKLNQKKFRIVTPGNTRIVTSFEGIHCLLTSCGKDSIYEVFENLEDSIKKKVSTNLVIEFLSELLSLNIIYETEEKHVFPLNIEGVKRGINKPNFRSISELNICPSSACNLKCNYCSLYQGTHNIDIRKINQCLKEAVELGLNIVNILGGEPCMFPKVVEQIIKECKALNIERITVSTNGLRFSKEIAQLWADAGLKTIQISTDVYKGEGKSFELNKNAIKLACDHFDEVSIAYVYYGQDNETNLQPIIDELQDFPVRIDLKYEVPYENTKLPISASHIKQFSDDWNKFSGTGPIITPPESGLKDIVYCGAGNSHAFISPNGDIKPCGFLEESIGNLNEDDFKQVWLNRDWSYYQKSKRIRKEICINCEYQNACIGGCLAKFKSREKNCIHNTDYSESINNSRCYSSVPK